MAIKKFVNKKADGEGFEPPDELPRRRFSNTVPNAKTRGLTSTDFPYSTYFWIQYQTKPALNTAHYVQRTRPSVRKAFNLSA